MKGDTSGLRKIGSGSARHLDRHAYHGQPHKAACKKLGRISHRSYRYITLNCIVLIVRHVWGFYLLIREVEWLDRGYRPGVATVSELARHSSYKS